MYVKYNISNISNINAVTNAYKRPIFDGAMLRTSPEGTALPSSWCAEPCDVPRASVSQHGGYHRNGWFMWFINGKYKGMIGNN